MKAHTGTANERIGQQAVDLHEARTQRDELLEALREITGPLPAGGWQRAVTHLQLIAGAAIKKVEKG